MRDIIGTNLQVARTVKEGAQDERRENSERPWPGLGDCKTILSSPTIFLPVSRAPTAAKTIDWATYGWMCDKQACMERGSVRAFCKGHKIDCCLAHSRL